MNTLVFKYFLPIALLALAQFSCDEGGVFQPKGNYISGYVIFADTNYISGGGRYSVALYPLENPLFSSSPICSNLLVTREENFNYFRITLEGETKVMLAVVWEFDSTIHRRPIILATYGCDTTHGCTTHKIVEFPNFTGLNYNMVSWADTSKRLF